MGYQAYCLHSLGNCCSRLEMTTMFLSLSAMFFNTLRPRQNGRHFAYDTFKCIFLDENIWISINISMKFVPNGPINNIPALNQIMAWHLVSVKQLSEPETTR